MAAIHPSGRAVVGKGTVLVSPRRLGAGGRTRRPRPISVWPRPPTGAAGVAGREVHQPAGLDNRWRRPSRCRRRRSRWPRPRSARCASRRPSTVPWGCATSASATTSRKPRNSSTSRTSPASRSISACPNFTRGADFRGPDRRLTSDALPEQFTAILDAVDPLVDQERPRHFVPRPSRQRRRQAATGHVRPCRLLFGDRKNVLMAPEQAWFPGRRPWAQGGGGTVAARSGRAGPVVESPRAWRPRSGGHRRPVEVGTGAGGNRRRRPALAAKGR